ncbi:hypothetical protein Bca4012_036212 [Brassica carinata]
MPPRLKLPNLPAGRNKRASIPIQWKLDLAWLTKTLEPATQLRRWALPTAGRAVAPRAFGKLAFLTLREDSGTIQLCEKERLSGDQFEELKAFIDIGDIFNACDSMKRSTKTGGKTGTGCHERDE